MSMIQTEFGGTNPISLSEYYGRGGVVASGTISIGNFSGASNFTPSTVNTTTSGTQTVPAGATNVVIELWGNGGGGGGGGGGRDGGGAGGYSRSTYACSGGQTISYTRGAAGTAGSAAGGNGGTGGTSNVVSGTLTITQMNANGGGGGTAGGGTGGGASGGNVVNTTGGSTTTQLGGTGITGINGGPHGRGGDAGVAGEPGTQGEIGRLILRYT